MPSVDSCDRNTPAPQGKPRRRKRDEGPRLFEVPFSVPVYPWREAEVIPSRQETPGGFRAVVYRLSCGHTTWRHTTRPRLRKARCKQCAPIGTKERP